jgi:hypothetical protein
LSDLSIHNPLDDHAAFHDEWARVEAFINIMGTHPAFERFGVEFEQEANDRTLEWTVKFTRDTRAEGAEKAIPTYFHAVYNDERGLDAFFSAFLSAAYSSTYGGLPSAIPSFLDRCEERYTKMVVDGHGNWIRAYEPYTHAFAF